ncbi:MAG: 4Fe-4S dicluster domain-containing protein [Candidatus Izemoplasma sp.]|nr:4Fe-4S dicluster domain-containing protein [Candidatus Izemoplasma sp.]
MAKGRIFIEEDTCKGCNLCTFYCPVHILKLDESRTNKKGYTPLMVTDMEKCIGCGFCATMCPDSVITVERFLKEANNG